MSSLMEEMWEEANKGIPTSCVIHSLRKLLMKKHTWRVRARLTRFSVYNEPVDFRKHQRLDMVMLDEEETAMDCQMSAGLNEFFTNRLEENGVYYVDDLHVAEARQNYRPVQGPYLAKFMRNTQLERITVVPETFPMYACRTIPFTEVEFRADDMSLLSCQ